MTNKKDEKGYDTEANTENNKKNNNLHHHISRCFHYNAEETWVLAVATRVIDRTNKTIGDGFKMYFSYFFFYFCSECVYFVFYFFCLVVVFVRHSCSLRHVLGLGSGLGLA